VGISASHVQTGERPRPTSPSDQGRPRASVRAALGLPELRLDPIPLLQVLEGLLRGLELVDRPIRRPDGHTPLAVVDLDDLAFHFGGDVSGRPSERLCLPRRRRVTRSGPPGLGAGTKKRREHPRAIDHRLAVTAYSVGRTRRRRR
jgi:hypothetical protein